MATTFKWYAEGIKSLMNKEIDLDTDTLKISLHTSGYTPNNDTDAQYASLSNEVTGTGYTAGGVTVTGCSLIVSTSGNTVELRSTHDPVRWANSTITARHAVLYDDSHANTRVIGYATFGDASPADVVSTTGNFDLALDDTNNMILKFSY